MTPQPIVRSLIYLFLKEIVISSYYLIRGHGRRITAYRDEAHLITSSLHLLHLHIHHRMRKLAGDAHATGHRIGLLMHELPYRMLAGLPVRSLISRINIHALLILMSHCISQNIRLKRSLVFSILLFSSISLH